MSEVFSNPEKVAAQIVDDGSLPFISSARVLKKIPRRRVKFKIRFEPWAAMAAERYPTEVVRVEVTKAGEVTAFPLSTQHRKWRHRFPSAGHNGPGPLCLFFPDDPKPITWSPEMGSFEDILGIISRHLQAEEYFRRMGTWPWEEAPHGPQASRGPRSRLMQDLARGRPQ